MGDFEASGFVCFLDWEEELLDEDSEDFYLSTGIYIR
jgi:hypothetical protein